MKSKEPSSTVMWNEFRKHPTTAQEAEAETPLSINPPLVQSS